MANNRWTEKAQNALRLSYEAASALGHNYVGSEHILLGLLGEKRGVASKILLSYGVTGDALTAAIVQAIGKGLFSLLMSMCRQLIVLLPAAWILSQLGGLNAVWWCFPVAEAVSLVLCLMLFRKVDVRMLRPLGQEA